jgi:hypothetical protein
VPNDPVTQLSFLYQIYSPINPLVGSHVIVWDGALGQQTLDHWDPAGYFSSHPCTFQGGTEHDPECNYDRVRFDLKANGFSELQVQAVFLKVADSMPQCDLKGLYSKSICTPSILKDAYQMETYMGNIMRYLKSGFNGSPGPYTNLQQVFLTSRIYGGYANGMDNSGTVHAE